MDWDELQDQNRDQDLGELEGSTSPPDKRQRLAAMFIMKTRESYRLPQSTIDSLLHDVSELCSSTVEDLKDQFFKRMAERHEDSMNSDEADVGVYQQCILFI